MCKMATKKVTAIFMTFGLVPLLLCFVALFLYGFLIVKKFDWDASESSFIFIPPCLVIVLYVLFLGCFYLDLLYKNNKSLIISAVSSSNLYKCLLFHMAVGASLVYAIDFDEYDSIKQFRIAGPVITSGLGLIVLCGAIGFSLWPLTLSREDSFNTVGCDAEMKKIIEFLKSNRIVGIVPTVVFGVVGYLVYISGVITFTVELVEEYVNSPKVYSFYLVPLYTTVGVFPVLIASTLIYNIWEKKAAGYLITPTSCLLSVAIGFCLLNHATMQKYTCSSDYFDDVKTLCNGSVTILAGLSLMMLVILVLLLLWSHLFLLGNAHMTVDLQTNEDEMVNHVSDPTHVENVPFDDDDERPSSDVEPLLVP